MTVQNLFQQEISVGIADHLPVVLLQVAGDRYTEAMKKIAHEGAADSL